MSFLSGLDGPAFTSAIARLPPPGRAFPPDTDTVQFQVFETPALALAQIHAAAVTLLEQEADPAFTIQMLPEWEADYGLPDPCTPFGATIQQRQAALLSKIAAVGGQSAAYMIGIAAALGYTVTVTEFRPFRAGINIAGDPVMDASWCFAWQVNVPGVVVTYFTPGVSAAGDPLWVIGSGELECRLRQIAPAHTVLLFNYS